MKAIAELAELTKLVPSTATALRSEGLSAHECILAGCSNSDIETAGFSEDDTARQRREQLDLLCASLTSPQSKPGTWRSQTSSCVNVTSLDVTTAERWLSLSLMGQRMHEMTAEAAIDVADGQASGKGGGRGAEATLRYLELLHSNSTLRHRPKP